MSHHSHTKPQPQVVTMAQTDRSQPQGSLLSQQFARHMGNSSDGTFAGFSGDFTERRRSRRASAPIDHVPSSLSCLLESEFETETDLTIPDEGLGKESSTPHIIQRGFNGATITPPESCWDRRQPPRFPPLQNCAYELAISERQKKNPPPPVERKQSWDGAAFVTKYLKDQQFSEALRRKAAQKAPNGPTVGQVLAQKINFAPRLFNAGDDENLIFPFDAPSEEQQKHDFAKVIDAAIAAGYNPLSVCSVCDQKHIPPGPPNTLQDRDTCGSLLPEWFPSNSFPESWNAFIQLFNDLVLIEEVDMGIRDDPNGYNPWNEHLHNKTIAWKGVGREGGWWACRTGDEEPRVDVPFFERNCKVCHGPQDPEEAEFYPPRKEPTTEQMKLKLQKWVDDTIQAGLKDDMGFVKGRATAEKTESNEKKLPSSDGLWMAGRDKDRK